MNEEERLLVEGFEASTLPDFSHADHLHVAWLYLRDLDLAEAALRFRRGARALATSRGRPENYHETVTWAYLLLIQERRVESAPDADWDAFLSENSDLLENGRAVLEAHYDAETLDSDLARRVFVLPRRRL